MLSLNEIQSYYPENLQHRGEFLLREYLQYKILEILFESEYALKFSFLGGTCLRIVHNNNRFSEDLDFDNFNLTSKDFEEVSATLKMGLERQGFSVEMRYVLAGAYHCYIRFPGLLYESGLSGHQEARVRINLDTESQGFSFEPESFFLNRFDVFTHIRCTPVDILLSQKIVAMSGRRRPQGRDFYDAVFLFSKTTPNFAYLEYKLNIMDSQALKAYLLDISQKFDFNELAKDVQPFLFDPRDIKRVELFPAYIQSLKLNP
ncbi:MAG TPA: nucleotidyl transferase AbiEii/AbiGii toxin family protein [Flavilitoribacter sp.]|nr:nucleotidyl transferase AbiEii/AbiGii toxin family protein [Flavilitoribacter sp.]HMQ87251.1 nucleotidyl transferase AbiEii/AbiGii toxin family protein [Flavilitoribacter sp.]